MPNGTQVKTPHHQKKLFVTGNMAQIKLLTTLTSEMPTSGDLKSIDFF